MTKLFLAGCSNTPQRIELCKKHKPPYLLESFYYVMKKQEKFRQIKENCEETMLDSGAFTFLAKKKPVPDGYLENYAEFIKREKPTYAVTVDVGDVKTQKKNTEELIKLTGRDILPVYHYQDNDPTFLEWMCKKFDFIMIGGLVFIRRRFGDKAKENLVRILVQKCRTYNKDVKIHLLGYTSLDRLRYHKPYSVDSTTWLSGGKFGTFYYFQSGRMHCLSTSQFIKRFGKTFSGFDYNKKEEWNFMQWVNFQKYLGGEKYGV